MRAEEARKNAGDPGRGAGPPAQQRRVQLHHPRPHRRRISSPTREFPVDPANPAGFDNSGESLTMSPALLNKYLQAARASGRSHGAHARWVRFRALPHAGGDGSRQVRHPADRRFLRAPAHRLRRLFRGRLALQASRGSRQTGRHAGRDRGRRQGERQVSAAGLAAPEEHRSAAAEEVGPIAKLQTMWRALPAPGRGPGGALRAQCVEMRDFVVRIRSDTAMQFAAPMVQGLPPASQPLLELEDRQFAAHRRDFDPTDLRNDTDPPPVVPDHSEISRAAPGSRSALGRADRAMARRRSRSGGSGRRARRYEASFARFASIFPDAFYVSERGRYFPDDSEDKGRLLSAGYHNIMGYFRDDTPLMELILDENGQKELEPPVGRVRLHRRLHRAHLGSVFLQPERRSGGQGRRVRLAAPGWITKSPTAPSFSDCATPIWPRPRPIRTTIPSPPEAIRVHFNARERHPPRAGKGARGRGAAASGGASQVRRARLSPAAHQGGTRRHSGAITTRCARRTG